jgi:hypothetical protein
MLLRDRLPVAKIDFPTEIGNGRVEFINTPLGVLLYINSLGVSVKEIKMYDRNLGNFALQNVLCGENLICLEDGSYACVSSKLQIEDVIGRSFLIKLEDMNVIARAEFMPRRRSNIDKSQTMVYN